MYYTLKRIAQPLCILLSMNCVFMYFNVKKLSILKVLNIEIKKD